MIRWRKRCRGDRAEAVITSTETYPLKHFVKPKNHGFRLHIKRLPNVQASGNVFRAYNGYVTTTRVFDRLPGQPSIYEVSCPYPSGMSGGPVLLAMDNQLAVAGVVIGSDSVTYAGVEHTVGVAMIADEIAALQSAKLGGAIRAMLNLNGAALRPRLAGC